MTSCLWWLEQRKALFPLFYCSLPLPLQIDLEPEGKVYVVIDLSGSSSEGKHSDRTHALADPASRTPESTSGASDVTMVQRNGGVLILEPPSSTPAC